jgi:hypothetical protein
MQALRFSDIPLIKLRKFGLYAAQNGRDIAGISGLFSSGASRLHAWLCQKADSASSGRKNIAAHRHDFHQDETPRANSKHSA